MQIQITYGHLIDSLTHICKYILHMARHKHIYLYEFMASVAYIVAPRSLTYINRSMHQLQRLIRYHQIKATHSLRNGTGRFGHTVSRECRGRGRPGQTWRKRCRSQDGAACYGSRRNCGTRTRTLNTSKNEDFKHSKERRMKKGVNGRRYTPRRTLRLEPLAI